MKLITHERGKRYVYVAVNGELVEVGITASPSKRMIAAVAVDAETIKVFLDILIMVSGKANDRSKAIYLMTANAAEVEKTLLKMHASYLKGEMAKWAVAALSAGDEKVPRRWSAIEKWHALGRCYLWGDDSGRRNPKTGEID